MQAWMAAVVLTASVFLTVAHSLTSNGLASSPSHSGNIPASPQRTYSMANPSPSVDHTNIFVIHRAQNSGLPRPDVYVTHPYIIVLIRPGPMNDDFVAGETGGSGMPTKNPGLTLVPESEDGK
jgi:hypothetical protein